MPLKIEVSLSIFKKCFVLGTLHHFGTNTIYIIYNYIRCQSTKTYH